jgi:anti-sigma regulatory factor (Ser/Thr protein kinase)
MLYLAGSAMNDLSLFLLDIVQNSIQVQAKRIEASLRFSVKDDLIVFEVRDNGPGLSPERIRRVTDPFYTTRTTRKVGLGLAFLKAAAEMADGTFTMTSEPHVQTVVQATFRRSHIDTPPLGDLGQTLVAIISHQDVEEFGFTMEEEDRRFTVSRLEIKEAVAPLSLQEATVIRFVQDYIESNVHYFLSGGAT